jgi:hypothetical protein
MQKTLSMLVVSLVAVTGCSRSAKEDGPPVQETAVLRNLVTQMGDASRRSDTFRDFFAKDATIPPDAERVKYSSLYFNPVGDASLKGESAVVKVRVTNDESSTPLGQVDWTFVKEGEQWKLKSAPLP